MATRSQPTKLAVSARTAAGSRAARRLRRDGLVPGIVYGGNDEPVGFAVDGRALRQALAGAGAVLDLSLDGAAATPVVLKDAQRDPVRGHVVHIDFVRVRLDRPIQAAVPLELTGAEDSPGVKDGGVLEQITRELNVEALPTSIPESISHDVSEMQINDTITLEALTAPEGVTLLDDPEQTVIATLTPPRLQVEEEPEIEEETELVGEEGAEPQAAAEGAEAGGEGAGGGEGEGGGGSE
jgi:large subunit ribosomal protein L25